MPYTPESAYSEFVDVAGNNYEYLAGPKTGSVARAVKYEISKDKQTLYFVMSDGNKIRSTDFQGNMMLVGGGIDSPMSKKDTSYLSKAGGQVEVDKNDNDILAERLGLMTEEEERADMERKAGIKPPPQSAQQQKQPQAKPDPKKITEDDEFYPIFMLLDKRKTKPKVKIEVEVDLEFIDKNTYTLIDSTLDKALEGVSKYFSEKVDLEVLQDKFIESMKKHMMEKFDAKPYTEESVDESDDKDTDNSKEDKKQEPKIEVVEEDDEAPSEKK